MLGFANKVDPVEVKVCGITECEDALMAVKLGAGALGFIFAPSPRRILPEKVRSIISAIPPFVKKVWGDFKVIFYVNEIAQPS